MMLLACQPHPRRAATLQRNEAIWEAYQRGRSKQWLARHYRLKPKTILGIIRVVKHRRQRERDG